MPVLQPPISKETGTIEGDLTILAGSIDIENALNQPFIDFLSSSASKFALGLTSSAKLKFTGITGWDFNVTTIAADIEFETATSGDVIINPIDAVTLMTNRPIVHLHNTVTLAELNAGKTILPAVASRTIRVVDFTARVSGTFATHTSADLEDTNGTPVAIQTLLVAGLTDGAVLKDGTANVTRGVGMWGDLTAGAGIAVTNTGAAATGGTSITFDIQYVVD